MSFHIILTYKVGSISINAINGLVFQIETQFVFCEVGSFRLISVSGGQGFVDGTRCSGYPWLSDLLFM
jgi:hypothetical protein